MISKERLEELIEQGATIYEVEYGYKSNKVVEYDLKNIPTYSKTHLNHFLDMHQVFETKEEAEWHKEFGDITRTIKLDLPKWEDIEKDKNFHYIRHFVITKNFSFFIEIYKFTNTISVSWSGGCKKSDPRFDRDWELTQENYTLACRKAKELFLGETK